MRKPLTFVFTILLASELMAQNGDTGVTPRADQIQAERMDKANNLQANPPTASESRVVKIGKWIGRAPIRVGVAGLGPGAGPWIGSVLEWNVHGNDVVPRVWGQYFLDRFYNVGTGVELQNISRHGMSFALEGSYAYAPQLPYYGPGPDSSIHNRTDFLREETLFGLRAGRRVHRNIEPGCSLGELLVNVGPGTSGSVPSTQTVFGPAEAPGIDVQSNYLLAGCSVQADFRELPGDPKKGTYAAAAYQRYLAQGNHVFSFHRVSAAAEQYISFLNRKRVIALRALTELSFHSADQVVPFYLQPTLASDTELRGFRRYRFYDENALALTAEYHWEVATGFDMAVFIDGGNVFHRPGEISLRELEASPGFGFLLKNRTSRSATVAARLDFGFSHEGFQVWFRYGKLF